MLKKKIEPEKLMHAHKNLVELEVISNLKGSNLQSSNPKLDALTNLAKIAIK